LPRRTSSAYWLRTRWSRHRPIGETEGGERLLVALQRVDALLQTLRISWHRSSAWWPARRSRERRADATTLLGDPRRVILGQHVQGIDQRVDIQRGEALHVEQTATHHLLHRRAIGGVEARRLGDLHLVLRHDGGAHLGGQRHVVRRLGVDGDAMPTANSTRLR
jgi:hypothetical protein